MKKRKAFSFLTAAVMAMTALPIFSVSAEGEFALGDVDMDGVITGHDSAMVSRMLNVDPDMLTKEQEKLADVNEDGTIDQTDLEWIHENEVYGITDVYKTGGEHADGADAAYMALCYYARVSVGKSVEIVEEDFPGLHPELVKGFVFYSGDMIPEADDKYGRLWINRDKPEEYGNSDFWNVVNFSVDTTSISELNYNLIDSNGDGKVNLDDAYASLVSYAGTQVGHDRYFEEGRYDLDADIARASQQEAMYTEE